MDIKYHAVDGSVFDTENECSHYENEVLPEKNRVIETENRKQELNWKREAIPWLNVVEKIIGRKPQLIYDHASGLCDLEDIYVIDKNEITYGDPKYNCKYLYKLRLCFPNEWQGEDRNFGRDTVLFGLNAVRKIGGEEWFDCRGIGLNNFLMVNDVRWIRKDTINRYMFFDQDYTFGTMHGDIYSARQCESITCKKQGKEKEKRKNAEARIKRRTGSDYWVFPELSSEEELEIERKYENVSTDDFVKDFLAKYELVEV